MLVMPSSMSFDVRSVPIEKPKRNLLLRIVDAVGAANRRRADREIARFIAYHGNSITDQVERSISDRFDQH
jgi:hypothetical protein